MRTIVLLMLVAVAPLAGCVQETSPPPPPPEMPDLPRGDPATPPEPARTPAPSFTLVASGMPGLVETGAPFTFTLTVSGEDPASTDHMGAHFGNSSVSQPRVPLYAGACAHHTGQTLPGTFTITCQIDASGQVFMRGHVRIVHEGAEIDIWSEEFTIVAVGPFAVTVTDMPEEIHANTPFGFNVTAEGPEWTTMHFGAHYGNTSTEEPTLAVYFGACVHSPDDQGLPGTTRVMCTIPDPGTHYLRGHLRIEAGETRVNWWSDELMIEVS